MADDPDNQDQKITIPKDETVHANIPVNMWRGIEAVGGILMITDKRLLFVPHRFNIQSQPEEISLQSISDVKPRQTMLFIPNGMLVRTKSGQDYKFVTWRRKKYIKLIKKLMANASEDPQGESAATVGIE